MVDGHHIPLLLIYTWKNNYFFIGFYLHHQYPNELGHLEIVGAIIYQLTKDLSLEEIKASGFDKYYVDHTLGIWPQAAGGIPYNACEYQSKGDPITDLYEDLAAEQKARSTYEYLIDLADDPDVINVLKFLREREVVHFQRFGEALRTVEEKLAERKFYMNNMNNTNNSCGCNEDKGNGTCNGGCSNPRR